MPRRLSPSFVLALLAGLAGTAVAEPASSTNTQTTTMATGRHVAVPMSADKFTPHGATVSPFMYLNRCMGGCVIQGGNVNDARSQMSAIPGPGSHNVGEFSNSFGQTGTSGMGTCLNPDTTPSSTICTNDAGCATLGTGAICDTADYEWGLVKQCMDEVYSPFAITISDTVPAGGVSYTEALIAGQPSDIGLDPGILGIAPLSCDSPQDNVISFSFANHHPFQNGRVQDRIYNICWTAAQETAHAYGLDHEYMFVDGNSACSDPMTYRTDCGGEKFFRNKFAQCGANSLMDYVCRKTQNSHQMLLDVFGPGTSLIPPPTVEVVLPADGTTVQKNWNNVANAGSRRGVATVELWLNGYKWGGAPGAPFGNEGQTDPSSYSVVAPNNVPNGAMFIVMKAYDDLDIETDSAPIKITLGSPCTVDSACATGQHCNTGADTATVPAGGCYWDAPAGQLGDKCTYNQFCTSGICQGNAGDQICSQECIVGVVGSCPDSYDCVMDTGTNGLCFPADSGGGCCNSSGGGAAFAHGGLAAIVLGIVARRRRPKRAQRA